MTNEYESNWSNKALALGKTQHEAEALIGCNKTYKWTSKDIRGLVLPIATRNGLNSDSFEYVANYLCGKYVK